jgi:hypothetical protein
MFRSTAAILLGAVVIAPAASAQSRWEDQVTAQIKHAGRILEDKGFSQTHDQFTGSLHQGDSEYLTLTLHSGQRYALLGVCDNDCSDIDFRLFDAEDNEVASDLQTDDVPIVQVSPSETQRYRLKVIMVTCKTSPCFYGVGVFGKSE